MDARHSIKTPLDDSYCITYLHKIPKFILKVNIIKVLEDFENLQDLEQFIIEYHHQNDEYSPVIEHIEKAVSLGTQSETILLLLAQLYFTLKEFKKSYQIFKRLDIKKIKNTKILYRVYGAVLKETDRYSQSIKVFEELHELYPDDLEILDDLLYLFELIGDIEALLHYAIIYLSLVNDASEVSNDTRERIFKSYAEYPRQKFYSDIKDKISQIWPEDKRLEIHDNLLEIKKELGVWSRK